MLNVCKGCTTAYAPDLAACPHCGSTERVETTLVGVPGPELTDLPPASNVKPSK